MSKKIVFLTTAAFAFVVSVSSAFAVDASHGGRRHARPQHAIPYNVRASAANNSPGQWIYGAREPFTAAEKRAFQAPTGAEVDRW